MKAADLLELLRTFYREKLSLRNRHVAAARHISDYDFNNTYQYVIAREEVHLNWLRDAITHLGGGLEDVAEPQLQTTGKGTDVQAALIREDRDRAQGFADTWRPKIEAMPNARHRSMLRVVIGETLEHRRFFDQAAAGRTDLLGRRADGAGTGGGVLPVRWIEQ